MERENPKEKNNEIIVEVGNTEDFKLEENKYGQLTYMRAYQGKIRRGDVLTHVNLNKKVKISRLVRMHSNEMEEIHEAQAGDIFAIFGIECSTGDTFTDNLHITMESMHIPEPVMSLSIKPKKTDTISKFMKALKRFQREEFPMCSEMSSCP